MKAGGYSDFKSTRVPLIFSTQH